MAKFREMKSPIALAACGAFLVPEPLGTCFVLVAVIWWLCRKIGSPCLASAAIILGANCAPIFYKGFRDEQAPLRQRPRHVAGDL